MSNKLPMKCPGYERRWFLSKLCKWYFYGQDNPHNTGPADGGICMKFYNNVMEPDKYDISCPTKGRKPQPMDREIVTDKQLVIPNEVLAVFFYADCGKNRQLGDI